MRALHTFPVDVLVVDDDQDVCELIAEVLRIKGYSVLEALSPEDARLLLEAGARPTLLVVDLCMPRMDGVTFCVAALLMLRSAPPEVLFCTGSPDSLPPPPGAHILLKPFDILALQAEVVRLIGARASPVVRRREAS